MNLPTNTEPGEIDGENKRKRDRALTLAELNLALHCLRRRGQPISISAVAKVAGVTPSLIHNRYPALAEEIRVLGNKSTRKQHDEKNDLLKAEREKTRNLRALVDKEVEEFAELASVNQALRAEITLLKAQLAGTVVKGSFGRKPDQKQP